MSRNIKIKYSITDGADLEIALSYYCLECNGYGKINNAKCAECDGYGMLITESGSQLLALVNDVLLKKEKP